VTDEQPTDRRVIACNYVEATHVASLGTKAYVSWPLGGNLPERMQVLVRSRGGRMVHKWENTRRLGNFRPKTLPPEHPLYGDERVIGHSDPEATARDLNECAHNERERSHVG